MSRTDSDLAKRVGQLLHVIDAVEELSPEDDRDLKDLSSNLHALLEKKKISNWQPNDIPEHVFEHLAVYIAHFAAPMFKQPQDPRNEILLENALARVTARPATGAVQEAEYF